LPLVVFICFVSGGYSQSFSSGSTGADGPLNLTTPGIITDLKSVNPAFDPEGDNVYHFTTINVAAGVTVRLTSKILSGPIFWLAQGNVTIGGTIDLTGETGHQSTSNVADRVPAAGGAGGYSGGVGGSASVPPTAGNGPGGGQAATPGTFTGSQYLIPLIGGSGAGGQSPGCGTFSAGGGGGGGAILIASSTSITLNFSGFILAHGGNGGLTCSGGVGGGSGGAIRLVAPTITLPTQNATLHVGGGTSGGGTGIVRLEAFTLNRGTLLDVFGRLITSAPFMVVPPTTPPSALKVTSLVVGGVTMPVNANPFSFPDATINSAGPVTVNVQAQFVPLGTIPRIIVMSETGPDQTVNCSALAGTLTQSTCSAQITFPTGGSRGFVKATWQ